MVDDGRKLDDNPAGRSSERSLDTVTMTTLEKNHAFAALIAAATGHRLERPGESMLAVDEDGRRALLRWARDAKSTIEIPRPQLRKIHSLLVAIGDPTGLLYEVFRLKKADLDRFRKDGSKPAVVSVSLRDAAEALEMLAPMQITARQLEETWSRIST